MEKEKIRVYLQYPWKTSDSQYYKSLVENPPSNIAYVYEKMKVGMITNSKMFKIRSFLKRILVMIIRNMKISIANIKETPIKEAYDLIHCAHCLSKNKSPWVADFEGVWQMWVMGEQSKASYSKVRETLLNENCKRILAWTETSKKEIIEKFPEIKNKIEIVSYAIPSQKFKKRTSW